MNSTTDLPAGASVRVLANPGKQYLVYLRTGLGDRKANHQSTFNEAELKLQVQVPEGSYTAEWFHPAKAVSSPRARVNSGTSVLELPVPAFEHDIALILRRL